MQHDCSYCIVCKLRTLKEIEGHPGAIVMLLHMHMMKYV